MTTYSLDPHVVRWMLAQAAPGPWTIHYREDDYQDVVVVRAANDDDVSELPVHEWTYDNSSLLAAAPDLARDYLRARADLDKLKAKRDEADEPGTDRTVPGSVSREIGVVRDFSSYLGAVEKCSLDEANVVISRLTEGRPTAPFDPELHAPVIDLDVPVTYVPSSTEGHGHLYVDVAMPAQDLWDLLAVMVRVGIVEEGFLNASKARGYTSVRLPWVSKEQQPDQAQDAS